MFEKQLICLLNSLADVLHSLRADQLPERVTLAAFGNVSLKFGATQVLVPHPVVAFVKGDAGVIDDSTGINSPLEISIPLVLIELELQASHAIIVQHITGMLHEKTIRLSD